MPRIPEIERRSQDAAEKHACAPAGFDVRAPREPASLRHAHRRIVAGRDDGDDADRPEMIAAPFKDARNGFADITLARGGWHDRIAKFGNAGEAVLRRKIAFDEPGLADEMAGGFFFDGPGTETGHGPVAGEALELGPGLIAGERHTGADVAHDLPLRPHSRDKVEILAHMRAENETGSFEGGGGHGKANRVIPVAMYIDNMVSSRLKLLVRYKAIGGVMIPDYQTLMRPVLESCRNGEVRIGDVAQTLADRFELTDEERGELLPSGKQTRFANRVHWAKSYLKQAGLVRETRRAHFVITDRGRAALEDTHAEINRFYLEQFPEFQDFQSRSREIEETSTAIPVTPTEDGAATPDEVLRTAHKRINAALSAELLDRVRSAPPAFFESLIVSLLIAMGYGGSSEDAGRALGRSGDDGVDGVIDQDPLGVDQIYVQAKRYAEGNGIGAGAIRDFFGALSLKKAHKGIFVTTSSFSPAATQTAHDLGTRIVLIDGVQLARLMIRYNIGCRDEEVLHLKKIDEDFFES